MTTIQVKRMYDSNNRPHTIWNVAEGRSCTAEEMTAAVDGRLTMVEGAQINGHPSYGRRSPGGYNRPSTISTVSAYALTPDDVRKHGAA